MLSKWETDIIAQNCVVWIIKDLVIDSGISVVKNELLHSSNRHKYPMVSDLPSVHIRTPFLLHPFTLSTLSLLSFVCNGHRKSIARFIMDNGLLYGILTLQRGSKFDSIEKLIHSERTHLLSRHKLVSLSIQAFCQIIVIESKQYVSFLNKQFSQPKNHEMDFCFMYDPLSLSQMTRERASQILNYTRRSFWKAHFARRCNVLVARLRF